MLEPKECQANRGRPVRPVNSEGTYLEKDDKTLRAEVPGLAYENIRCYSHRILKLWAHMHTHNVNGGKVRTAVPSPIRSWVIVDTKNEHSFSCRDEVDFYAPVPKGPLAAFGKQSMTPSICSDGIPGDPFRGRSARYPKVFLADVTCSQLKAKVEPPSRFPVEFAKKHLKIFSMDRDSDATFRKAFGRTGS